MPRRRAPIRLTHITADGRRFTLEEVPGLRNPQIRLWNAQTRRYRRVSLDVPLRDDRGRPSPTLARAALLAAEARILADMPLDPPRRPAATLVETLTYACDPATTVHRDATSEQTPEWCRAAAEALAVHPAGKELSAVRARDGALLARSAFLRVNAGATVADWTLAISEQRARLTGAGDVPSDDAVILEAYRAYSARQPQTAQREVEHAASPTARGWVWARRAAELFRAMLRYAGRAEERFAVVAGFELPLDLNEQLKGTAVRVGYSTDVEPFRPRHGVTSCRDLLGLIIDPRQRMWTCLAPALNGKGARRAMRSHLQLEHRRVRVNHGSARHPLLGWATLEPSVLALLQTLLATTYHALEQKWQARGIDYPLIDGLAWRDGELKVDRAASLPDVDPRFRLLLMLGAEGRAAQVARTRRSDLRLLADTRETLLWEPSAGTKRAPLLLLGESQLDALAVEMEVGYLREYETAYHARQIADYPLFPGGRLAGGRATRDGTPLVLNDRTLNDWAHALEEALGLPPVAGRGLRAWRRAFVDLYQRWTTDALVLDLITGHASVGVDGHGSTRTEVYLDRKSLALLRRAQAVTEFARTTFAQTGRAPDLGALYRADAEGA